MNIDTMPAGREMDALVWYKVMNPGMPESLQRAADGALVPHYSTDIAAAWEVVEKMREKAALDHIEERDQDEGMWVVQFCAKTSNEPWWHEHAFADTVPLAICRAALKSCL